MCITKNLIVTVWQPFDSLNLYVVLYNDNFFVPANSPYIDSFLNRSTMAIEMATHKACHQLAK